MIHHVYQRCNKSRLVSDVIIATDSDEVMRYCVQHDLNAQMTSVEHQSGTDRCAEVAQRLDTDYIINVQGDEPLIHPSHLDTLITKLSQSNVLGIATLGMEIEDLDLITDPNVVKLVASPSGVIHYFSRSAIPYTRDAEIAYPRAIKHLGVYAFERKLLLELCKLPPSINETTEKLEQLRWLDAGYRIGLALTDRDTVGVDVIEDVSRVEEILAKDA